MATTTAAVKAALLHGEPLISFPLAARQLPGQRGADHMHPSALFKWAKHGCKTASGQVVKLEAIKLGARWYTSAAAIARFSAALSGAEPGDPATVTPSAPAADEAARLLESLGA